MIDNDAARRTDGLVVGCRCCERKIRQERSIINGGNLILSVCDCSLVSFDDSSRTSLTHHHHLLSLTI
jgi:hypothetical protein